SVLQHSAHPPALPSFPTRRSSDLSTNHTPCDSARPASERQRFLLIGAPSRRASSRTHVKPRLWRVSANSDSGLPSPTISRSSFLDRKSTRLNSSHVAISYAVFCLK